MYGIWLFNGGVGKDDWLRCPECRAVLAFEKKRHAFEKATKEFGFDSYSETRQKGWCEVRPLPASK